ncbi:MAG TPA: hypothetical protein P5318_12230 [Candidatus Hydrogenedentes bacterium]|nr:hypothetical protein [Candidatus Hydrogenedentota bacterium]HPC16975.1 hypothetical protein [Candidatus Hydrogenedentota bacterium]HRT20886.1 hypothetical protein [Candidatus Hydrogenedentota bacterium]HRT66236.1 hypothetical protein [Candidatus Hydrogenedentota bacterium]
MKRNRKNRGVPAAPEAPPVPMPDDEPAPWEWTRGLTGIVAGLTLAALIAFMAGVGAFARHGDALVRDMDRAVAGVAHEQAIRFERAGDYAKAKEAYLLALEGRFDDRNARADALMRLGRMLRWHESPEAGLPYLRQALADPGHDMAIYDVLCEALIAANAHEELTSTARQYFEDAGKAKDNELRAQAKYFEGRGLLALGEKEKALDAFIESETIRGGGLGACEAGILLYNMGQIERAKGYLETCAYASGSSQSEYAAQLLKRIAEGS